VRETPLIKKGPNQKKDAKEKANKSSSICGHKQAIIATVLNLPQIEKH